MSDAPPEAGVEAAEAPSPGGMGEALDLMREALGGSTAAAAPEAPAPEGEPDELAQDTTAPVAAKPASRRGRTIDRVQTEAEQRVSAAEQKAEAAETEKQRIISEYEQQRAASEAEQRRLADLTRDSAQYTGSPEEYAEAQRLSRMDPDAPGWDWDKHKQAVEKLNRWDQNRQWAAIKHREGQQEGAAETAQRIYQDFVVTLSADLPEDKREGYTKHAGGIPGAVRYYHQTLLAPIVEEKDAEIAELRAELDRLRAGGGQRPRRSPEAGGAPVGPGGYVDESRLSPEQLMAHELRQQQLVAARRRS